MSDRPDHLALVRALQAGERSAVDVVEERLHALHEVHESTGAVAWFDDDLAVAEARRVDAAFVRGGPVGPLHGVPVTVKDWIDVRGFPCRGVSDDDTRRPDRDATVVARLRSAGAVVIAKSHAWGPAEGPERVRHPIDPDRTPGGSSTGEAVLVASGASILGIGSDSGGSVRLPAAWCGVQGHKPTAGLVPTTGHFPRVGAMSDGRTQIGPLTDDPRLIELVLGVISGPDDSDGGVAPVGPDALPRALPDGARFAVVVDDERWPVDPAIADAVERAAAVLEAAGLIRVDWSAPWLDDARDITERYWTRWSLTGAEVAQQLADWDRFRSRYLRASAEVAVILSPVTCTPAPVARPVVGDDFVYCLPASLTGSPALSVPVDTDAALPVAVQVVGRPWTDAAVLALGRHLGAELS